MFRGKTWFTCAVSSMLLAACGGAVGDGEPPAAGPSPEDAKPETSAPSTTGVEEPPSSLDPSHGGTLPREPDARARAYVEAFAAQFEGDPALSDSTRQCLAEANVAIIGVDAYEQAGFTLEAIREGTIEPELYLALGESLSAEQSAALEDAWMDCTRGEKLELVWMTELDAAVPRHDKLYLGATLAADDAQTYVGLGDGVLHALDSASGSERWSFEVAGANELYPAVSADTVYLGTNTGAVHALDRATGSPRWSYDVGTVTGPPVIVGDVVVVGDWTGVGTTSGEGTYVGDGPNREEFPGQTVAGARVHALGVTSGDLRWRAEMPSVTALAAASNDVLVIASAAGSANSVGDGVVIRLDPATGEPIWRVSEGGTIRPAIDEDSVYTVHGTTVVSLDAETGEHRWSADASGTQYSGAVSGWPVQVAATSEAVIAVIGGDPWWLVALDPSDGRRLWELPGDSEGGFDIATVGDDVLITPTNLPFYVADAATATPRAYVNADQLPTLETNPVTPRVVVKSAGLWIAAGGGWIVGFREGT